MVSRTLTVNNPEGLHMRPAGVVAKEMGKFACDVTIVFGDKTLSVGSLIAEYDCYVTCELSHFLCYNTCWSHV